jgi:hypothetical protein
VYVLSNYLSKLLWASEGAGVQLSTALLLVARSSTGPVHHGKGEHACLAVTRLVQVQVDPVSMQENTNVQVCTPSTSNPCMHPIRWPPNTCVRALTAAHGGIPGLTISFFSRTRTSTYYYTTRFLKHPAGYTRAACGATLEYHQLPHGSSTLLFLLNADPGAALQPQRDAACTSHAGNDRASCNRVGRGRSDANPQQALQTSSTPRRSGGRDESAPHMTVELCACVCAIDSSRKGCKERRYCKS